MSVALDPLPVAAERIFAKAEANAAIVDRLARLEHAQWVQWSQSIAREEKLTGDRLARWKTMWVPYDELPDDVKEQDRVWARKVLATLDQVTKGADLEYLSNGTLFELIRGVPQPELRKYSEDQARDEQGRFAAGGGSGDPGSQFIARGENVPVGSGLHGYSESFQKLRGETKDRIAREVGARLEKDPRFQPKPGLDGYDTVNLMNRQWANMQTGPIQRAAIDEFGLKGTSEASTPTSDSTTRAALRAMYDHTQAELAKAGISKLMLYRGIYGNVPDKLAPVTSWTSEPQIAHTGAWMGGGGVEHVLRATFPASRILSSARTGFGSLPEYEFTVLGGPTQGAHVEVVKYSEDQPRDDNGRWTSAGGSPGTGEGHYHEEASHGPQTNVAEKKWAEGMTPKQRGALMMYTGGGFRSMNMTLRGNPRAANFTWPGDHPYTVGPTYNGKVEFQMSLPEGISHMDSLIAATPPLEKDTVAYRFVGTDAAAQMFGSEHGPNPGRIIDRGFASVSLNKGWIDEITNVNRSSLIGIEVRIPAGTHAAYPLAAGDGFEHERELILPRGSEYRVVSFDGQRAVVELTGTGVTKFDDSQPRDEAGRWTDGGGESYGGAAVHGSRELSGSLGIPRSSMPQIRAQHLDEFFQYARAQGVGVEHGSVPASQLRPAQNEYNPAQVDQMPAAALQKPVMISSDHYVLDGTNRWLKALQSDPKASVPIVRLDAPAVDALALMHSFPKSSTKDVTEIGPTKKDAASVQTHIERMHGVRVNLEDGADKIESDHDVMHAVARFFSPDMAHEKHNLGDSALLDQMIRYKTVEKYDPDQPRDEHGQWTGWGSVGLFYSPTHEEMLASHKNWSRTLTPPLQQALRSYKMDAGGAMNTALRHGTSDRAIETNAKLIDTAITKAPPLERDTILYRWMGHAAAKDWKRGAVVNDKGFVSASLDAEHVRNYAHVFDKVIVEMHVPQGTHAAYMETPQINQGNLLTTEQELLLPRNGTLYVVSRDGNRMTVNYAPPGKQVVRKYNENHDELGRFTFGDGGSAAGGGAAASAAGRPKFTQRGPGPNGKLPMTADGRVKYTKTTPAMRAKSDGTKVVSAAMVEKLKAVGIPDRMAQQIDNIVARENNFRWTSESNDTPAPGPDGKPWPADKIAQAVIDANAEVQQQKIRDAAVIAAGGTPGTKGLPGREPMQEAAAAHLLTHGGTADGKPQSVEQFRAPAGERPQAYIYIGPPGAGKSTFLKEDAKTLGTKLMLMDADEAKRLIPEFNNGRGANYVHEESSAIKRKLMIAAAGEHLNMAIPVIGDREESIRAQIKALHDAGYDVHLRLANVTKQQSLQRTTERFIQTGRFLEPAYVWDKADSKPEATYKNLFKDRKTLFASTPHAYDMMGEKGYHREYHPENGEPLRQEIY